jgi:hypothetical protein
VNNLITALLGANKSRKRIMDRNEDRTIPSSIRGLSLVDFAPEKLLS